MIRHWAVFMLVVASVALSHQFQDLYDQALYESNIDKRSADVGSGGIDEINSEKNSWADESQIEKRSADVGSVGESDEINSDAPLIRNRRSLPLDLLQGLRDRLADDIKAEIHHILLRIFAWLRSREQNGNSLFDLLNYTVDLNAKYVKVVASLVADAIKAVSKVVIAWAQEFAARMRRFLLNTPPYGPRPLPLNYHNNY